MIQRLRCPIRIYWCHTLQRNLATMAATPAYQTTTSYSWSKADRAVPPKLTGRGEACTIARMDVRTTKSGNAQTVTSTAGVMGAGVYNKQRPRNNENGRTIDVRYTGRACPESLGVGLVVRVDSAGRHGGMLSRLWAPSPFSTTLHDRPSRPSDHATLGLSYPPRSHISPPHALDPTPGL
jgi:hypothetical protein